MPRSTAMRATAVALGANFALFILKATASGLSDSLTIFSETLNSLGDLVATVAILICVRWAWKHPDDDHPFGHRRAEPVAGLLVAIFTGILGFEVCRTAVDRLIHTTAPTRIGPYPIIALVITAVVKACMVLYFTTRARQLHSPAFSATAADSRNDVLVAAQGLIAVILAEYHLAVLDAVASLLIGVYILYSGHRVGMENIDYLMGKSPDAEMISDIRAAAGCIPGVLEVGDIRAHYVGTFVHVECTAHVDGTMPTHESHDIAEDVRESIERLALVDRAFVHIEPAVPPSDRRLTRRPC